MSELQLKEVDFGGKPARTITIRLSAAGRGDVLIDGQRVKNCRGVEVKSRIGEASTVTLELIALNVDLEVVADHVYAQVTATDSAYKQYVEITDNENDER